MSDFTSLRALIKATIFILVIEDGSGRGDLMIMLSGGKHITIRPLQKNLTMLSGGKHISIRPLQKKLTMLSGGITHYN